jgi:tight adherence protein C
MMHLSEVIAPERQPLLIALLITLSVFATIMLIVKSARQREEISRRAAPERSRSNTIDASWEQHASRIVDRAAAIFSSGARPNSSTLRRDLIQAGYFFKHAPILFSALRIFVALSLPSLFLIGSSVLSLGLPVALTALAAMGLALLGLILPSLLLDARVRSMQQRHRDAFPDMMDLLVVCVESGQSVHSAFAQVSREIMPFCPALGFNLYLLNLELRAGGTIDEALRALYGRIGLEEVRSLSVLLRQSEELGTSISGTLRIFSDEMRDKRLIRAETKANLLPVKMALPLGFFIFPVILLVILVPIAIRIKNSFV